MAFNFETAGLAFKPSAGGKFMPQKLGDPPAGFGEHSNTALRIQIDRLCEFLADAEYRLPRRVLWEMLASIGFASMTFGDELPTAGDFPADPETGVSAIPKAHLHADYSQDGVDMRVLAYIGDEWREDIDLMDAILLPMTNLVATIREGQVDFTELNNLPTTLEGFGIEDGASADVLAAAVDELRGLIAAAEAGSAEAVAAISAAVLVDRGRLDGLADVAQSGAYEDLTGRPDLATELAAVRAGAAADLRDGVAAEGDTLAKLFAALLVERGRVDTQAASLAAVLDGSVEEFDTFVELFNRIVAGEAEEDAALAAINSALAERLTATQEALIALIEEADGDKAAIRAALGVAPAGDLSEAVGALQDALDDKQARLAGTAGQRVGFDAAGNAVAEDAPVASVAEARQPGHVTGRQLGLLFAAERAMVRHQYRVVADGAGNIAQSFAKHPLTGERFSINAINSIDHVMVRHGVDRGIDLAVEGRSDVNSNIPHQGFFFVPDPANPSDPWIIGSAGRGIAASENKISRFKYREAGTPISFETINVFDDGTGGGSTSPSMSASGRYVVVRNAVDATGENEIKIFETETLLAAFDAGDQDQVNAHVSSFILDSRFENNAQRDLPIQSLLIDDELVYVIMGYGDTRGPLAYAVCRHDGTLIAHDLDWQLAAAEAQTVERSASDVSSGLYPREVESARWAFVEGAWRPEISVGCGSSGNRTNFIFILGMGAERERNIDYWKETWTVRNGTADQSWTVEMKRLGQTCTGFAYLNNVDVSGFAEGQNLEFEGMRYQPNQQWPVPILTSGVNRSVDSVGVVHTAGRFHIRELDRVDVDADGDPKDADYSADIMDAVRVERTANYIRASLRYDVDL